MKPFDMYKFADKLDIALMIIGSIAALGVGACHPLMFVIYQKVLDNFLDHSRLHSNTTVNNSNECNTIITSPIDIIPRIIKYYIILGFASILLHWIACASWIAAAERQVRRIRYTLFRNILRQEIGWFDVHKTGELSSRLIGDLDRIKDGMSEKVPDFISLIGRMIGSLIYSLLIGWKLTLVYLSISPLIILVMNLTIKMIATFTIKEIEAFASASSIAQEVLQNIRAVTAFHGQEKEEER
ncbi:unnamed protein product [Rotaria sp. Silwood1]|nr:unnamed protein product [Rotaria sp. Silwood1]